eukprot:TRINITY_DN21021_c0_g1_i2.p1 TRINITY_DN21021_c0_g1~~TRINITY_DN21021_c0_g1_i2.p1  ORF type:complete len:165 (-),score=15.78 TRINITY_DN21021_c0_g1_i2:78-572(-)
MPASDVASRRHDIPASGSVTPAARTPDDQRSVRSGRLSESGSQVLSLRSSPSKPGSSASRQMGSLTRSASSPTMTKADLRKRDRMRSIWAATSREVEAYGGQIGGINDLVGRNGGPGGESLNPEVWEMGSRQRGPLFKTCEISTRAIRRMRTGGFFKADEYRVE